jgi:hypothetical protein
MPCINVREGNGVVIVYKLDACGVPETGAGNKLVLTNISEISWEEQIDEGDEVTERNFVGRKCYTDTGQDEITYVNVNLTSCGINPALDNFLMASTSYGDGIDGIGFGRKDLNAPDSNVAIEVLMELDAGDCIGEDVPIAGWFFPLVKNWRPNGAGTLNGSDLVKPQFTGKGYKNNQIFDSPVWDLDRWDTDVNFDAPNEYYGFYVWYDGSVTAALTDPATGLIANADCDPTTLAATS